MCSKQLLKIIKQISENTSIPLQVAGGLRTEEKISEVLDFASRAVIGTIAIQLKEENKAFRVEKYVHQYPNCWRTDKPILYYPLDSWFIKISEIRNKMSSLNKKINWKPKSTGTKRFGNWLENANDWNLSRSRFWGIPLPIWRNNKGDQTKVIGSISELISE